jgi:hypothetical protein
MADEIDLVSRHCKWRPRRGRYACRAAACRYRTGPRYGRCTLKRAAAAAPAPKDKPASLRDQLSAAFKGEDGKPTDQQGGQPREANGKFAPKEAVTDTAVQPPQGQEPAAAHRPYKPRRGLTRTQFAALPAEMQQQVARTMAAVEEQATRYRGYEQLETVIGQRRQAWAMQGMSEAQAVSQLLALSDFAGKSPTDFVQWFSGQHGIDIAALADGGGDDEYIDPVVAELRQQVADLTGHVTGITQGPAAGATSVTCELCRAVCCGNGYGQPAVAPAFRRTR